MEVHESDSTNENLKRQQAELEFVEAAYDKDEAWVVRDGVAGDDGCPAVVARVVCRLRATIDDVSGHNPSVWFQVQLDMTERYPESAALLVNVAPDESQTSNLLLKGAFDIAPKLCKACSQAANDAIGTEAVLLVIMAAGEWLEDHEVAFQQDLRSSSDDPVSATSLSPVIPAENGGSATVARRLIYSHHLVANSKRRDIASLGRQLELTGFVKIGWPGLLIVEGTAEHCDTFYDTIRRWNWKYLVVRGEMQELGPSLAKLLRFPPLTETDDMSVVADHCREVGLEALFRTSMKIYDDSLDPKSSDLSNGHGHTILHGALVNVDHMNNGPAYRKWLQRACGAQSVVHIVKQCSRGNDGNTKDRPWIMVALVGDEAAVQAVLKRWRTEKVDFDGRGKPCLERQMHVLLQGPIPTIFDSATLVNDAPDVTPSELSIIMGNIGGRAWADVIKSVAMRTHSQPS